MGDAQQAPALRCARAHAGRAAVRTSRGLRGRPHVGARGSASFSQCAGAASWGRVLQRRPALARQQLLRPTTTPPLPLAQRRGGPRTQRARQAGRQRRLLAAAWGAAARALARRALQRQRLRPRRPPLLQRLLPLQRLPLRCCAQRRRCCARRRRGWTPWPTAWRWGRPGTRGRAQRAPPPRPRRAAARAAARLQQLLPAAAPPPGAARAPAPPLRPRQSPPPPTCP